MRYLLLLNILLAFWSKFNRIAESNALKEEAGFYFEKKDYIKSVGLYEKLLQEYKEEDENVRLNLANSYFHLQLFNSAIEHYKILTKSGNPEIKSMAYLQLGVVYSTNKKKDAGLNYFKEAMKALPSNDKARYNYELLKKENEQQPKEEATEKRKETQDGKNQTTSSRSEEWKKSESGHTDAPLPAPGMEPGDEQSSPQEEDDIRDTEYNKDGDQQTDALASERLQQMQISERQAKMILKTMKNSEVQYIQQRRKVNPNTLPKDKPDW
jgi:tetratricopeptide (TPR) repeat protein